ncbi:MAG TPA: hypothetical protein VEA59_03710 [Patescibacteria group bacterium]|nr:hypothetical protein [Patescibacteria group bacterium]
MRKINQKGITLLEFLVLISVLTLVAAISVNVLRKNRQHLRDSNRFIELSQLKRLNQSFFAENSRYIADLADCSNPRSEIAPQTAFWAPLNDPTVANCMWVGHLSKYYSGMIEDPLAIGEDTADGWYYYYGQGFKYDPVGRSIAVTNNPYDFVFCSKLEVTENLVPIKEFYGGYTKQFRPNGAPVTVHQCTGN